MSDEIWCFLEREKQGEVAAELARLGRQTKSVACGIVVGAVDKNLARELGQYGIAKIYSVESPPPDTLTPEDYAHLVTCLIRKAPPHLCLFPASCLGNEVAVRAAVRLGAGLITWCTDFSFVSGKLTAIKKAYEGRASKRMVWRGPPPYLATVAPEVMEAIAGDRAYQPVIVTENFPLPPPAVRLVERSQLGWRETPLSEAVAVLGVGAGVKSKEGVSLIERLAELLDMPIGGTKRAEELGLIPKERKIGASGIYIESNVYIAIGISGAPHHMVGTRKVKHLVAINQDRACPLFDTAELGIVDDFRPVVVSLIDRVSK